MYTFPSEMDTSLSREERNAWHFTFSSSLDPFLEEAVWEMFLQERTPTFFFHIAFSVIVVIPAFRYLTVLCSLVPRQLPDFILQPWRKVGSKRPVIIATSRTENDGLG